MARITGRVARGRTWAGALAVGLAALTLSAAPAIAGGYEQLEICASLTEQDQAQEGLVACTAAIDSGELTRTNTAIAYYNRGNAQRRLGRHSEAAEDFTRAIELWPELDHAWNNRGGALARLCRADAALADFEKAMEIDPEWIKRYQQALQRAGVEVGVIDGVYGPKTQAALLELIKAQCEN